MTIQEKKDIIRVGFGFDVLSIDEVIEMCFNPDSEKTINKLKEIQEDYKHEL